MKHEWRKKEKSLYIPKAEPTVIDVGKYPYFTLCGEGNPNSEPFAEAIGVLYSLSYAVKMMPKRGIEPQGYYDYTVYPLEGIWDLADKSKAEEPLDKDNLKYKIMIRQPDFLTEELAAEVIEYTRKKKPHELLGDVEFERLSDGLCLQMLHLGSYDDEPASFAKMHQYCDNNGYKRIKHSHKEIYLTDARKTTPEKLKTTLRFAIENIKE